MNSPIRRQFLRAVAGAGVVGMAGCSGFATEQATTTPTITSRAVPTDANFEFAFSDGLVTIRYDSGTPIPARNLAIQASGGTQVSWYELGSTTVSVDDKVTEGSSATIGASILNWPTDIRQSSTVRVIYLSEEGSPTTLAKFQPVTETSEPSRGESDTNTTETPADAMTLLDDFEDSDFSDWTFTDGSTNDVRNSSDSIRDNKSIYFEDVNHTVNTYKEISSDEKISQLLFWFRYKSRNDNNLQFWLMSSNQTPITQVREYSGTLYVKVRKGRHAPVANVDQNTWYKINVHNVQFSEKIFNIEVTDGEGNQIGERTNATFWKGANSFKRFEIRNKLGYNNVADPLWVDEIKYK